jgi:hypothetical protein
MNNCHVFIISYNLGFSVCLKLEWLSLLVSPALEVVLVPACHEYMVIAHLICGSGSVWDWTSGFKLFTRQNPLEGWLCFYLPCVLSFSQSPTIFTLCHCYLGHSFHV